MGIVSSIAWEILATSGFLPRQTCKFGASVKELTMVMKRLRASKRKAELAVCAPIRVFSSGLYRHTIRPKVMKRSLFLAFIELMVYPRRG